MTEKGLYDRLVNDKWPRLQPIPTDQEAITGAKRLYRKAMGRPWPGKVKIVRGNRHTWIRGGVLCVNPNQYGHNGWPDIVHGISHYCHRRLNPQDRDHSDKQAYLERDLTDYVLEKGFLEGKLKSKAAPKKKTDPVQTRYLKMIERKKNWEKKSARAKNALQKVKTEIRQYERRHGTRVLA
jgi:hypothetical protein